MRCYGREVRAFQAVKAELTHRRQEQYRARANQGRCWTSTLLAHWCMPCPYPFLIELDHESICQKSTFHGLTSRKLLNSLRNDFLSMHFRIVAHDPVLSRHCDRLGILFDLIPVGFVPHLQLFVSQNQDTHGQAKYVRLACFRQSSARLLPAHIGCLRMLSLRLRCSVCRLLEA